MKIAKELPFISGYAAVEQHVLVVQELSYASCKSLQDFVNQLKKGRKKD